MLKRVWRTWLVVARTIGRVQSVIILALAYFVVIAPFALAVRLLGDPLGLTAAPAWRAPDRQPAGTTRLDGVRHQF